MAPTVDVVTLPSKVPSMGNVANARSQHGEDLLVAAHFGEKRGGYFVEVGALDGVTFSNTYLLEIDYGWTGVLIEADPLQAAACADARPGARTVAVAATSPARAGNPVELTVVEGQEAHSSLSLSDRTRGYIEYWRSTGEDVSTTSKQV